MAGAAFHPSVTGKANGTDVVGSYNPKRVSAEDGYCPSQAAAQTSTVEWDAKPFHNRMGGPALSGFWD